MRRNGLEKYLYYGLGILAVLFVVVGLTAALNGTGIDSMPLRAKREETVKGKKDREKQEEAKQEEAKQETAGNPNIRVLLMTDGYQYLTHPSVSVSSDSGLILTYGEETEECAGEGALSLMPDDARFQKGNIRIQAKEGRITVGSLNRGYGTPSYEGVLELRTTAEGIVIINELPVESYLCGVVPSEMPCTYELEALKAQAVCARSYVYRHMQSYAYPEYEAHVNDSTTYQVYGDSAPADTTAQAVKETEGQVVKYNGSIVTTYYYSTSCGRTTGVQAWGTAPGGENAYLESVEVKGEAGDYEKNLPWYRWEAYVPIQTLSNLVGLNTGIDVGTLESIDITETGPGGVALKIEARGDKGTVSVETENKIRRALGGQGYTIKKQDGTEVQSSALLPSAFFTIEKSGDIFAIKGGGFGHGIGMSQNGANEMAKNGKDYKEILTLFFQGVTVEV
ncbi:SpoIID/LytB domain-containing protein [Lachnospiraceae bacterium 42-17]